MDNFIVSARKYRPATFDLVVGQDSITTTLKNAIRNNHLAQAFLFCGPRGVGKTTCARILAKTINCFHPTENLEPCDKCESCISFNRSASFNIHELDGASNNSVDDIRNLVDQVRIPPQVGKYKVYIIDEVHMLSQSAFNAFLKTLEEPPEYAKFILATTEKHKIIPTILSRCQIFDFKRISVQDISGYLSFIAEKEEVQADEEALHIIAQKADGALRDALSFFDQLVSFSGKQLTYETTIDHLNVLDYTYYFKIIDHLLAGDTTNTLLVINEIIERGFDGLHFIIGLGEHLRNLLVCKDPQTVGLLEVSGNIRSRYTDQAATCQPDFLIKALEINNTCDVNYKSSNNKRLHLELALLRMCSLVAVQDHKQGDEPQLAPPNGKVQQKETIKTSVKPVSQNVADKTSEYKQPAPARTYKAGHKTISIKPENHKQPEKSNHNSNAEAMGPVNDFTQEQLVKVWSYFVESIGKQYPNFYSTVSELKPVLKENFVIELSLNNKVGEMNIAGKKTELLEFLRDELENYKITLDTLVVENNDKGKPFIPNEKYKEMATRNPLLKEFKETLDLELEY